MQLQRLIAIVFIVSSIAACGPFELQPFGRTSIPGPGPGDGGAPGGGTGGGGNSGGDNASGTPTFPVPIDVPVPIEFSRYKPSDNEMPIIAQAMCQTLSNVAKARAPKDLVIAFEAGASHSPSATQAAYNYHWKMFLNQVVQPPMQVAGAHLLQGLIVPLLKKHGVKMEFLVFADTTQTDQPNSPAEQCATAWYRATETTPALKKRRITITGHGYGGEAAYKLALRLLENSIPVDLVVTLDPRTHGTDLSKPGNVRAWWNFYQSNTPSVNGRLVTGADGNIDLTQTGIGHTDLPGAPDVIARFK